MNREDILRMAHEARFYVKDDEAYSPSNQEDHELTEHLEHFATLVAQQENERIARKIEQLPFGDTSASFAVYVRECPPCNGNCNQGRTCPARK